VSERTERLLALPHDAAGAPLTDAGPTRTAVPIAEAPNLTPPPVVPSASLPPPPPRAPSAGKWLALGGVGVVALSAAAWLLRPSSHVAAALPAAPIAAGAKVDEPAKPVSQLPKPAEVPAEPATSAPLPAASTAAAPPATAQIVSQKPTRPPASRPSAAAAAAARPAAKPQARVQMPSSGL
jgi:hypothetical protein